MLSSFKKKSLLLKVCLNVEKSKMDFGECVKPIIKKESDGYRNENQCHTNLHSTISVKNNPSPSMESVMKSLIIISLGPKC